MKHPHYNIELHLSPLSGELRARVELMFPFTEAVMEASKASRNAEDCPADRALAELTFILHRSLHPQVVAGDDVIGFTWSDTPSPYPFVNDKDGAELTVKFGHPVRAGETRCLTFEYRGCPGIVSQWQVNRLTPEWVELGLYAPWFPFRPKVQFTYCVRATTDPGYEVFGIGRSESPDGSVVLTSTQPTYDIVVLSAPRFLTEQRATGNGPVNVHFTAPDDAPFAVQIADDGAWVLDFLGDWLGQHSSKQPEVVIAPRTIGGAYVRPGLVVMSRPEDDPIAGRQRYFRWVAHEFAHLWWHRAPVTSWEDWLNEAFAEFCSLVALRQKYGEEVYAARLDAMRLRTQDLPPIRDLPRTHEKAYDVLYIKGCVILAGLESNIGRELMTQFLREVHSEQAITTEAVIQVLSRVAGGNQGQWLDSRLRS